MPRIEQIYAHAERDMFRRQFGGANVALVTTTIIPHERNDVPGRTCPCCGSETARALGKIDDLSVLINRFTGRRSNRWKQETGDGTLEQFDEVAGQALPWGTPDCLVWHAPIIYRCTESQVDALTDDDSEVMLFTGGWRSGKTFLGDMWWSRGWVKFGGRGEIFWLVAPALMRTWKNMQKIFYGKESDPPLLPCHNGEPMLAHNLPDKHTAAHMHFTMLDLSRVELYHAGHGHGGHLEGDDVKRIHFEEAARVRGSDAYQVLRGRVAQSMGAIGMSTVPDDEGAWIYDEIVQPIEQKLPTASKLRMIVCDSYDNVFVTKESIARLEAGTTDPKVIDEKIHGKWSRIGAYAYGDVWGDNCIVDTNSHKPEAWGFKHDCTRIATKALWGARKPGELPGVDYVGSADSNWNPQTALIAKIFGDIEDPMTWALCFVDEMTIRGDTRQAAEQVARLEEGKYRGRTGLICDASMFHAANYHGGKSHQSNDAAEYKALGFRVTSPINVDDARSNPDVMEARKLVRIMMRAGLFKVSRVGCPQLIVALSKVPNRPKIKSESGNVIDSTVYNFDDCARYPSWRFFSKRLLPTAPGVQIGKATRDPHRAA